MKCKLKPITIDAVQYVKGLEDGIECTSKDGSFCQDTCNRFCRYYKPFILDKDDTKIYIHNDTDIILTINGKKIICDKETFDMIHE